MDSYRAPVAVQPRSIMKPEGNRLRRKLQKIGSHRHNSSVQFTTSNPKASESQGFLKSVFGSRKSEAGRPNYRATLPEPLPFDLSDQKWAEYSRTSRYTAADIEVTPQPQPFAQKSLSLPVNIIPELAHLNLSNNESRNSSETISTNGPSTPSTTSSASATRRQAKTPVTHIGQLEAIKAHELALAGNSVSIDEIAASYRALLNSRNSILQERFMTPFQSFDEVPSDLGARAWEIRPATPIETFLDLPPTSKHNAPSPTSSDGTFVGYEEDVVYIKPVPMATKSTSLQPVEVRDNLRNTRSMASILPEDPTVQIMFDLLAKELSAAASGNMARPGTETSALQIWVMIEAYEKLQDKVADMGLESSQSEAVQTMFSTWLKALYTIHDGMTGNDGQHSESDYGEQYSTDRI